MSDAIPPPAPAPRIIHAGRGQPIELAADGGMRTLSTHQAEAVLAETAIELRSNGAPLVEVPAVSTHLMSRLAGYRLAADLATALASNLEARLNREGKT